MRDIRDAWNRFWFTPQSQANMTWPRIAVCVVTALWFVSFWPTVPDWFSADGVLSPSLSARMLAADQIPSWQVWSPLWWTESTAILRGWLAVGAILSLLAASGWGGRLTMITLCLWVIAWANRLIVLSGLVEPTLIACLGYLIIEPGKPMAVEFNTSTPRTSSGLALRLLQTHWWLLIAAGLLSQLGGLMWWRGEGVWWLAAAQRSNLFTIESLRGRAIWINALSHAVIVVQALSLWWLIVPAARTAGIIAGILVAVVYGGVADHGLFALLQLAMLTSYLPWYQTSTIRSASADRAM